MALAPSVSAAEEIAPPSPLGAFADFFRLGEAIPGPLRSALAAYEEGRFFTAIAWLRPLLAAGEPAYALDDARFLEARSLVGLGWDDLAGASLERLLAGPSPGPYYVLALRELTAIHDRAGRPQAIAAAWERHVDRPFSSAGPESEGVRELVFAFGALRSGRESSTPREKQLLAAPKELAVLLEKRRERASDRVLYRSGLALFALGRHAESHRALRRIGLLSPYYPYARYTIAQNLFALGRPSDAVRTLVRLERYPKITPEERALGSRSRLLHAAILFETGDLEGGIAAARSIADGDPEAPRARLLVASALVGAGKPALAVVYDTATRRPFTTADAKRALVIGEAYASLGDVESTVRVLHEAVDRIGGSGEAGAGSSIARFQAVAVEAADERRRRDAAGRAVIARGVRTMLAHDGPWSLGTLVRRLRALLGAGPWRDLARGTLTARSAPAGGEWLPYASSPRRPAIELALDRLADLEAIAGEPVEAPLRILNGYLAWLAAAPVEEEVRRRVARRAEGLVDALRSAGDSAIPALRFDPGEATAPQAARFRRRLVDAGGAGRLEPDRLRSAAEEVAGLLRRWIDSEIEAALAEREAERRALELDLEVALAAALARQARPVPPLERPAR